MSCVIKVTKDTNLMTSCARTYETTTGALATRILTAWGDEESVSYHGANFAKGQVTMFGGVENANVDPILEITSDPGVGFFDVRAVRTMLGQAQLPQLVD